MADVVAAAAAAADRHTMEHYTRRRRTRGRRGRRLVCLDMAHCEGRKGETEREGEREREVTSLKSHCSHFAACRDQGSDNSASCCERNEEGGRR